MNIKMKAIQLKRSVVVVMTVTIVAFGVSYMPAFGQYENMSVAQLEALLQTLQSQLNTTTPVLSSQVAVSTNSACPYVWSRNMGVGSRGEDVRRLQQFLNGDAQTRVAASGIGSSGSESTYYGPGTMKAVARFQDKYASEVLTPLGLSRGTGYFGMSTRAKANDLCQSSPSVVTTTPVPGTGIAPTLPVTSNVVVPEGGLAVSKGRQVMNGDAIMGAQRLPFTTFVLTTGNDPVSVKSVNVRRGGLSSDDMFESVAIIDSNQMQIGTSRRLNSNSEADINARFVVPRNSSVTLYIIGNISNNDGDIRPGERAYLEVVSIDADGPVSGLESPIIGATHTGSEAVELATVTIESRTSGSKNLEVGEEDVELGEYRIILGASDEDAWLRSITFEQTGSMDLDDIEDLIVRVNRKDYDVTVNNDRMMVVFPGDGLEIEERKRVSAVISGSPKQGSSRTIQFTIDDPSDVHVVGMRYGYGLAVNTNRVDGRVYTVSKGEVTGRVARRSSSERKITYGDEREVAAFQFTVDEQTEFQDLTFKVEVDGLDRDALEYFWDNDQSIDIDNLELVDADDNSLATADSSVSVELSSATSLDATDGNVSVSGRTLTVKNIEFGGTFELDAGKTDLFLRADLDSDWKEEGITLRFRVTDVDRMYAVESDEKWSSDEKSDFIGGGIDGGRYTLEGSGIEVTLRRVSASTVVAGAEAKEFVEIEFDARDAIEDVVFESITLGARAIASSGNSNIENLLDCRIVDGKDNEVTRIISQLDEDSGGSTSTDHEVLFEFDGNGYVVEHGETATLNAVCDVDDPINNAGNNPYFAFFTDNSGDENYVVEYSVGGDDDDEYVLASRSSYGNIKAASSGRVKVNEAIDGGATKVVAVGDGSDDDFVKVGTLEIEPKNEAVTLEELTIELDDVNQNGKVGNAPNSMAAGKLTDIQEYIKEVQLRIGSNTIDYEDYIDSDGRIVFDEINDESFPEGEETHIDVYVSLEGIDDNSTTLSGVSISPRVTKYIFEGESTGQLIEETGLNLSLAELYMYRSVPTFEVRTSGYGSLGDGVKDIFRFKVRAGGDELALGQLAFNIDLRDHTGNDLQMRYVRLYAYTNDARTDEARTGNDDGLINSTALVSAFSRSDQSNLKVAFDEPLEIDNNDTVYFTLKADLGGTEDDDRVVVNMETDVTPASARNLAGAKSASMVVWTPESNGEIENTGIDWFNGYRVLPTSTADDESIIKW